MDKIIYHNLAGAINYRFPDTHDFWEVHQNHLGIFLEVWDEAGMGGPKPEEATILTWIQEFEALSDYEKGAQIYKDNIDLKQALISRPLVQALLVAPPQQIDTQVDAASMQELRNIIKILILAVRMLVRN